MDAIVIGPVLPMWSLNNLLKIAQLANEEDKIL